VKHLIIESIGKAISPKPREATAPPKFLQSLPEGRETVEITSQLKEKSSVAQPTTKPIESEFRLAQDWSTPDQQEIPLGSQLDDGEPSEPEPAVPIFAFIGKLKSRYWLMEDDAGLVVMDPRAARARGEYFPSSVST